MKKTTIVQLGRPSRQWKAWLGAFADAGFKINSADPLEMELLTIHARPGEIVLFDGMVPNLSRFIKRTRKQSPDAHIIVATEADSFVIRYEVMLLNEINYVSGPLSAGQFIETIRQIVFQGVSFAA